MRCVVCGAGAERTYIARDVPWLTASYCARAACQAAVPLAVERFIALAESVGRIFYVAAYEPMRGTHRPGRPPCKPPRSRVRKHLASGRALIGARPSRIARLYPHGRR